MKKKMYNKTNGVPELNYDEDEQEIEEEIDSGDDTEDEDEFEDLEEIDDLDDLGELEEIDEFDEEEEGFIKVLVVEQKLNLGVESEETKRPRRDWKNS